VPSLSAGSHSSSIL
jgi:RNA recognition motif-containing protein